MTFKRKKRSVHPLTVSKVNFRIAVQNLEKTFWCDNDSEYEESDDEFQSFKDRDDPYAIEVTEENELRTETVLDLIAAGSCIALYSPPTSFYLCKVMEVSVAVQDLSDEFNHVVLKTSKYLKCNYLKKANEKKQFLFYKLIPNIVFVLSTQVMSPMLPLGKNLLLSVEEY